MTSENDDDSRGMSKWFPTILLLVAVAGFVSLAWYSYQVGKESVKEEDLLVVEAEDTPVKEKPLDPGGMKFPNQDKTIFETFSNNQQPAKVERVLPAPEEPIVTNTETEKTIEKNKTSQIENKAISEETIDVQKIEASGIDDKKTAEIKTAEKPVEQKELKETKTEKKIEPAKDKIQAKSSGQKIQLGAYGSDKEARDVWVKIQKKFPELSVKSPIIVRADIVGKGTFYRLRVGGFSGKDSAKSLCKTLSSKGQACILVSE